jgi:hypothetical protein
MIAAAVFKFQLPVQFGYTLMISYAVFCLLAVWVLNASPTFFECTSGGLFGDCGSALPLCRPWIKDHC